MTTTERKRRSPEEMIKDLEDQITQVRARAQRRKVKVDPALRHVNAALSSIDKALDVSEDIATRQALDEARVTLSAILSLNVAVPNTRSIRGAAVRSRGGSQIQPQAVLEFIANHLGSRCEDIAAAIGADTKAMSPVLKNLKAGGKLRSEGHARGTRYFLGTGRG